ncbi:MAG: hypothetical protein ABI638_01640 [Ignavibacteriota bacterium]
MKRSNKTNRVNLFFLELLIIFRITAMAIVIITLASVSLLIAGEDDQPDQVTIKNDEFRFEVTVPQSWSFKKIVQQDPYEEMKSGLYSSSISTGEDEEVPENWNGFKLISTDTSDNNPQPFLIIYGHNVSDQNREEFATLFEQSIASFSGKDLKADWDFSVGDAKGFDCTYGIGAKVRYTVLYQDGIRVVIMYFFPSSDPTLFEKYAVEVDSVIRSLLIE